MDETTLNDQAASNEELAPVVETPKAEKKAKTTSTEKPAFADMGVHDDFDWSVDKRNVAIYNKNDRETYDKLYEETFKAVNDNEMVNGTIVGLTKTDVVVNIGYKSDGLISLNEFRDLAEVKAGDRKSTRLNSSH